jgi:hypothetical protein
MGRGTSSCRYSGNGSLGYLVAACLWATDRNFAGVECLFYYSRAFDMAKFQTDFIYGAIG